MLNWKMYLLGFCASASIGGAFAQTVIPGTESQFVRPSGSIGTAGQASTDRSAPAFGTNGGPIPLQPQLRSLPQAPAGSAPLLTAAPIPLAPLAPNDFQRFVQESIGRSLPLFGVEFFENAQAALGAANPFAPVQNSPVSSDYQLGPGDEVLIRGWGSIDIDVRAVIDRNGFIAIPRVGTVQLSGVKAAQAESAIRGAISRYFRNFELNVTFGQLRSITVYVVGQARRPGTYFLSSMSTLVSALFASGGPSANGSMRRVQLKRGNAVVTEIDLYGFLAQGDKSRDAKLQDGDVIVIPAAFGHVALTGKVGVPGVYELKGEGEALQDLLAMAGGLPVVADPRRAYLERIAPGQQQPRRVEEFALDAAGLKKTLQRGDLLTVLPMTSEFSNAVVLRGNVSQAVRMPWRDGLRIRDLIPSRDILISPGSVRRQNEILLSPAERIRSASANVDAAATAGNDVPREARDTADSLADRIGNLIEQVNFDYAVVERLLRTDLTVQLISFNLGRVLANAADPDNLLLQPGDVVTVFSVNDVRVPVAKRRVYVRIEGEVANPGIYQLAPGDTIQTLVDRAGGLTRDAYLFGSGFFREEVRKSQAENLEKLLRRLESESAGSLAQAAQSLGAGADTNPAAVQARVLATQQAQRQALDRLRSLKPSGRIALDIPPSGNNVIAQMPSLRVETGDRLLIPNRPDFVYVFGSVNTESALIYRPGKTVVDYLEQAGLSGGSDRDNIILVRADGSAMTNSSNWSNTVLRTVVMPGDTLVLPEKLDRETSWSFIVRNTRDITQIFYQLGLSAAALKTLRQ